MNAETKWTPGPWKVEMTIYDHCACEVVGGRGIAPVWSGPRAWADATLMASAPDLFEALANLRAHVSFDARTDSQEKLDAMRAADAALLKAGG